MLVCCLYSIGPTKEEGITVINFAKTNGGGGPVVVSSANLETSISRVKYQLSGEKGHGFNIGGNVPLDVIKKQPTKHLIKKKKKEVHPNKLRSRCGSSDNRVRIEGRTVSSRYGNGRLDREYERGGVGGY